MANETRQVSIFINGKEVENTIKAIASEKRKLNNEVNKLVVGTDEYKEGVKELARLDGILASHRNAVRGVEDGWMKNIPAVKGFLAAGAGLFAVDRIISYGQELGQLAIKTDALARKSTTVLGDQLGRVTDEAERNAKAMGLTTSAYVAQTAGIADLLIPMGFQRKEAADMSVQMENLAGAMSEWSGGQHTAADASSTMSKALLGEREELKAYGIAISEEDVKQRLLTKGMQDLTGQRLAQAKAIATMELIMEKSVDAQTSFATNTDSLIRQQALFKARIEEISEKLAKIFMPILAALGGVINAALTPLEGLVEGFSKLANPVQASAKAFKDQKDSVQNLEKNINPLLGRYDELTSKTKLTTKEQKELKDITKKVSEAVPGAVSAFDDYGKALKLNTAAARDFIETEKVRLKYINQAAIATVTAEIKNLQTLHDAQKQIAEDGKKLMATGSYAPLIEVKLTQQETDALKLKVGDLQTKIDGAKAQLAVLNGETLKTPTASTATTSIKDPESDKAKREAEKEQEKLAKFKELLLQYNNDIAQLNATKDQSEAIKIKEKYDKHIADLADLLKSKDPKVRKEALEIVKQLQAKNDAEILAMFNKHNRELEEKIRKHEDEITATKLGEHEKRLNSIKESYKKELDEAKQLEESSIPEIVAKGTEARIRLEKAMNAELQAEKDKFNTENAKKLAEEQAKEYADTEKFKQDMLKLNEEYDALLNDLKKPIVENKVGSEDKLDKQKADVKAKAELEIEELKAKVEKELAILGDDSTKKQKLEQALADKIAAIRKKANAESLKLEAEFVNKNLANYQKLTDAIGSAFVALGDIIGSQTEEAAALQKVAALAKIAIDTAQAISGVVAVAGSTSLTPIDMAIRIAAGVATVLANIATAKNIIKSAPEVKQKADGGFAKVIGKDDGQTYDAKVDPSFGGGLTSSPTLLVGERGTEYVVPNYLLRNPMVANFTRIIEDMRMNRGVSTVQREVGGFAATTAVPSVVPASQPILQNDRATEVLEKIYDALLSGRIIALVDTEGALKINDLIDRGKALRGY